MLSNFLNAFLSEFYENFKTLLAPATIFVIWEKKEEINAIKNPPEQTV